LPLTPRLWLVRVSAVSLRTFTIALIKRLKRARRPASVRGSVSAGADYHLPVLGQPPLPALSQVRVTVPCALAMVNFVPSVPFEVTESV